MLALGLVPTLLVSILAYLTIHNELTRRTDEQLTSIANSQQQKINSLLQQRQEEATRLANQFDLQSALGRYESSGRTQGGQEIYNILLNKQVATPGMQAVYLIALNGTVINATVADAQGTTLNAKDYFVAEGQESSIRIQEDPRDGIDKLYMTLKVNVNNKEAGYLNLVFRIDDITAAVQDYTGLGATGETIVASMEADGSTVALFPLRFNTDAALKTNLNSLTLFDPRHNSRQPYIDYRGAPVLVAIKAAGFADWVIAAKMDVREALGPIAQLGNVLLLIVALSCGGIILFALYFSRFFTKPILLVAKIAQSFGGGDFSKRVDFKSNDEIGVLGASINTMGHSLQDFVTSLQAQRNRLEIIINSTAESIMAIDKNGKILLANRAASELAGLPKRSIVGKTITDVFTWQHDTNPLDIDYNKEGLHTYDNAQFQTAAGNTHYIKIIVTAINGQQEPLAPQAIVTVYDETKSRDLENMKIDFVSMAAHELRTPLASIRGYLELITFKQGARIAPEIHSYMQQALTSTSELGGLIDNLLGVTRIERGTLTFNPEQIDLAAEIKQTVRDVTFAAAGKNISLAYDGPANNCFVLADKIALHEVINNLITNAIKYTSTQGSVFVRLTSQDQTFRVQVQDTGIGIPKNALPHLFTKFYRAHGGLDSGSTGTGLGLFIAKSIIERHGGTIGVESEEGKGSIFTFTLPKYNNDTNHAKSQFNLAARPKRIRGNHGWTTKNITR